VDPVVLTIAGSDSSGGAGIQADLRTFAALNCIATSAVTCVTAQTPKAVSSIEPVNTDMVSSQIQAACDAFPIAAAKTGMLYSAAIVAAAAVAIKSCEMPALIIDPVMMASSGTRLLQEDAMESFCSELLPMATVATPNVSEAEVLSGEEITSIADMESAAREIGSRFGIACVVTGGHLSSGVRSRQRRDKGQACPAEGGGSGIREKGEVTDTLYYDGKVTVFSAPRIDGGDVHGTGCVFSAALTAFMAHGQDIVEAVEHAKEFVSGVIERAVRVGKQALLNTTRGRVPDE
jgi:hydroxymethylpyrimidine/phosphomethylpyrimidine kinase